MKMKPRCLWAFIPLLTLAVLPAQAGEQPKADPLDWTYWRGPEMNGISREKNIPAKWSPDGENLLWKREDLGSRSTPIVMNGKLYMITRNLPETEKETEKVVCLDAATGETIWENVFNIFLSDVPDTRVGWSCVVGDPETGNVYALGVCDLFQCIDGKTGKTIWSHSLSEEYGMLNTYGGRTNMPIVFEDLVIISGVIINWGEYAQPNHRFIAFDKTNGQAVWFTGTRPAPNDTSYSAPVLATIEGQMQLIVGAGDGKMYGFQPRTGKIIWNYPVTTRGINTSPLVVGNTVYGGHGEENVDSKQMGALFALDATKTGDISKTGELWRVKELFVGRSSPLLVNDRIYVVQDDARLVVIDPKTGKNLGNKKLGTSQRSNLLYADGKIFATETNGRWYTFEPTENGVKVLHQMRLEKQECHGSPIVSHGRMYVPTTGAMYCVGFKDATPSSDPIPPQPEETPVAEDTKPAQVQVVPVESLLLPGQKQQYKVRLYNAKGQFLGEKPAGEAQFTLTGPGKIGPDGKYETPSENIHAAAALSVKVGELTGTARIRIVPELPWSFDFSDGMVPITWVAARYRHIVVDFDFWSKLREEDPVASELYIYLLSSFTNSGQPAVNFNLDTARQTLTGFLRFLDLDSDEKTVEHMSSKTAASLDILKRENVISEWNWSSNENGLVFTAKQGTRQVTEGEPVMLKITTIPVGTRSQAWMGHTHYSNYTIEADVYATEVGGGKPAAEEPKPAETPGQAAEDDGRPPAAVGKLPDIGIIAQRYTLDLMGANQQLQARTWPPQTRMMRQVPFEVKPNMWYHMKYQASVEGEVAVVRGKVWPKGAEEPAEWTVVAEDPSPNLNGSPGLFGNASVAELFYDNIKVYPNKSEGGN